MKLNIDVYVFIILEAMSDSIAMALYKAHLV